MLGSGETLGGICLEATVLEAAHDVKAVAIEHEREGFEEAFGHAPRGGAIPAFDAQAPEGAGEQGIDDLLFALVDLHAVVGEVGEGFKWYFNAKPDLVIQVAPDRAVCIEAKLESGEGSNPSNAEEKREFDRRGLARAGQTELQKHMFEALVGMQAQFVYLVAGAAKGESATHSRLTWRQAFDALDLTGTPGWLREWVARV